MYVLYMFYGRSFPLTTTQSQSFNPIDLPVSCLMYICTVFASLPNRTTKMDNIAFVAWALFFPWRLCVPAIRTCGYINYIQTGSCGIFLIFRLFVLLLQVDTSRNIERKEWKPQLSFYIRWLNSIWFELKCSIFVYVCVCMLYDSSILNSNPP